MLTRVITTTTLALALVGGAGPAVIDPGATFGFDGTQLPARPDADRDHLRLAQQVQDDMKADPRRPARPDAEPTLAHQV